MKIGLFCPALNGGGAERMMVTVANSLAKRGHTIDFVLMRAEGEFLSLLADNVNVIELSSNRIRYSPISLTRYIRRREPEALLSTINAANIMNVVTAQLVRKPPRTIIRIPKVPEYETNKGWIKREIISNAGQVLFNKADKVIAISEGMANQLERDYNVSGDDIEVIYNPAFSDDIVSKSSEPTTHRFFDGSGRVILSVGRLTPAKGYDTLLRSFARVLEKESAKLVILGQGPEQERLETLSSELEIESHIDLPGFDENPYRYMAKADLFVSSSRSEGFGNVIVEALGCGTSVVATDCPSGPAEILEGGKFGRLVPPEDSERMAAAIIESLNSPTDSDYLRSRAEDFSEENIVDQYERLLTKYETI